MHDSQRILAAENIIATGDIDMAWGALYWVFCSTDLEPDGFHQTARRAGLDPVSLRLDILDKHLVARRFYFGADSAVDSTGES